MTLSGPISNNGNPLTIAGVGKIAIAGPVSDSLINGGVLVPGGANPGKLTIGGSYSQYSQAWASAGSLNVRINGTVASGSYDSLSVGGAADLSGSGAALNITLGYTPVSGDSYTILSSGSLTGTLNGGARVVQPVPAGCCSSVGPFNVTYTEHSVAAVYEPLLMLATLSSDVYSPANTAGINAYSSTNCQNLSKNDNTCGFFARAFATADDSQVVIAFRGTDLSNPMTAIMNIMADASFVGNQTPTTDLVMETEDAASFVRQVITAYPNANITLTGHSLGGALAQLVGQAANLDTYTFNAPGAGGKLYANLMHRARLLGNERRPESNRHELPRGRRSGVVRRDSDRKHRHHRESGPACERYELAEWRCQCALN